MRLINTKTMQLEDFTVRKLPGYAILSHTWGDEEVTFQDLMGDDNGFTQKAGFPKILRTCVLAYQNDIEYAWVDTCCIDKTSSAELTEAINSMYRWYKDALICYAFLSDLPSRKGPNESSSQTASNGATITYDELRVCRWFTRGWTLQELIAPKTVQFYDQSWTMRGTKADYADHIHRFTHINPLVLHGGGQLVKLSIAERMTWASRRTTTRAEDMAYCLLGIFDINMPLMYGEGEKAFTRLQQEIIKNNSDLSIFGWSPEDRSEATEILGPRTQIVTKVEFHAGLSDGCKVDCGHGDTGEDSFYSVLAESPSQFVTPSDWDVLSSVEHSVTNRGIKIYCSLIEICMGGCDFYECKCCPDRRKYVLIIGRTKTTFFKAEHEHSWGIVFDKIGPDTFVRSRKRLVLLNQTSKSFVRETRQRAIYLLTQAPHSTTPMKYLPLRNSGDYDFIIHSATPDDRWNSSTRSWYVENESPHEWGMVFLEFQDLASSRRICILFLGSGRVFVIDPREYSKEIGQISQIPSILTLHDIYDLFTHEKLRRNENKMDVGEGMKVVASLGNPLGPDWALDVRMDETVTESLSRLSLMSTNPPSISHNLEFRVTPTESLEGGRVSSPATSSNDNSTHTKPARLSKIGGLRRVIKEMKKPRAPAPPKPVELSPPTSSPPLYIFQSNVQHTPIPKMPSSKPVAQNAPAASQWAVSSSAVTHSASGSIQAVIIPCNSESRGRTLWSATRIRADHPVFSSPVLPIPALVEIPMVMQRLGTQSTNRADLDNQKATWLNIEPDTGFAPAVWQSMVGTVIVARKDRKPLLPDHVGAMFDYCGRILDYFGNGDGAPIKLYNRAVFEKFWKTYFQERMLSQSTANEQTEEEGDLGNDKLVKSPYEV